jgi:hypothetical protein
MYSDVFVCVPIFGLQCGLTFFQFDYTTNENLLVGEEGAALGSRLLRCRGLPQMVAQTINAVQSTHYARIYRVLLAYPQIHERGQPMNRMTKRRSAGRVASMACWKILTLDPALVQTCGSRRVLREL